MPAAVPTAAQPQAPATDTCPPPTGSWSLACESYHSSALWGTDLCLKSNRLSHISNEQKCVWVTWGGPPRTYIHDPPPIYVYVRTNLILQAVRVIWGEGWVGVGLIRSSGHPHTSTMPKRSAFHLLLFSRTGLPVPDNYRCNRGCQLS